MSDINFITTEYAGRIEKAKDELIQPLKDNDQAERAEQLEKKLNDIADEKRIKLVFIGQYTAGKSSIISALSGDNSIKIDSDITTEHPADYSWGNVILTDTPGLYTENKEHDARTIEMIKQSDLLIYCITSDLFNQYTLEDFKKWAFEYGYAGKMFLVINKMSKESGDYDSLCINYLETLNKALYPHSVGEFTRAFVDAKDYRDGKRDGDRELIEYSHFEGFIEKLNDFIRNKGELGKFDTPIMILKAAIDETIESLADDETTRDYSALLSRLEKSVDQLRKMLSAEATNLIRKNLKPIVDKGYEISRKIGFEEFEFTEEDVKKLVESCCETLNGQLDTVFQKGNEALQKEIEGILESDLAKFFFEEVKGADTRKTFFASSEDKAKKVEMDSVRRIVNGLTGKTVQLSTKGGAGSAGMFIKASEASGSTVHSVVLEVGHFFGHKFQPWEAVNIAKNIGNVAKVVGPVASVITFALDVKNAVTDSAEAKKAEKARIECRHTYYKLEENLENQYMKELSKILSVYDEVTHQVQEDREKVQNVLKKGGETVKKLLDIRRDLTDIQKEIF